MFFLEIMLVLGVIVANFKSLVYLVCVTHKIQQKLR